MTKYTLVGFYTITFWGGGNGWKRVIIETNNEGLSAILKNPLQDYISFGVASVDYVELDIYKKTIMKKQDKTITTKYEKPIEHIEKGTYKLTEKETNQLDNDFDVAEVNY